MSELRQQLHQARSDHQSARYPGDLAADLLRAHPTRLAYATPPRRHWLFWTNVAALGAVAATLSIVLWRAPTVSRTTDKRPTVAVWQPRPDDEFSVVPELAGATLTPQGVDVVPAAQTTAGTMPALPSFPSMTDVLNSAETTTTDSNNNS